MIASRKTTATVVATKGTAAIRPASRPRSSLPAFLGLVVVGMLTLRQWRQHIFLRGWRMNALLRLFIRACTATVPRIVVSSRGMASHDRLLVAVTRKILHAFGPLHVAVARLCLSIVVWMQRLREKIVVCPAK